MHVLGINERKSVNVMGHNAPEWTIAFIGGIFYNSISTGVYSTNMPDACLY
jgi:long-subunit acyl-CoA synthetase (AMP-forming)